jgi:hypothetical protein
MRILLLFCLFLFVNGDSDATTNMQTVQLSTFANLNWKINDVNKTIVMQLTVSCACWIAIGWHAAGPVSDGMTNADVVLGLLNSTTNKVT